MTKSKKTICQAVRAMAASPPFQLFQLDIDHGVRDYSFRRQAVSGEPGQTITVEKLTAERGEKVTFGDVVLLADGATVTTGIRW